MAESNFVDYVKIYCRSGKGGRGSAHMRREKYVPNGGPDGGDGGRGGHVILRGNRNYWTLLHLKYDRHVFATHGGNGSKNKSFGKDGEDKVIEVPCGTVVYNAETGEYICDITEHGQEITLLKGGRGGLGNWHFRTATRQAPRFAQPGEPMQELMVILELKLLADVGLVGFPNAGKSTLLSTVSAARPKIANYPFTTLEPNLGIVSYREGKSFVMADIPGIIEGASEGKGLGLRFLRHIERNSLLLFMVPGDTDDIRKEYEILLNELATFNPEMLDKQRVQKKSDVTGSVTSVGKERLGKLPVTNVLQAVQGAAAGVTITQTSSIPGDAPDALVRGQNSINANSGPYIVVDGVPISKSGGTLNDINPNDIESMEILKDASATAIYGTNGANGVILITTKRGTSGKPTIRYNGYFGVEDFSHKLDFCDGSQITQRYRDYVSQNPGETMYNDYVKNAYEAENQANGIENDWIDAVSQTGIIQDHT